MNIDKLKRMITVYDAGSFRRASQELGMSIPALAWSIRRLEEELNARLFDRGSRGIKATPLCEKLIQRARRIVAEQAKFMADVEQSNRQQRLEFGVHSSMLDEAFAQCLVQFREAQHHVSLNIREGFSAELIDQVRSGEIDFAYCAVPPSLDDEDDDLVIEPIAALEYSLIAHPDHPVFDDIASERPIAPYSWAKFHSTNIFGALPDQGTLDDILETYGHGRASQVVSTLSLNLTKLLVIKGGYIGLIADNYIATEVAAGAVRRLPGMPFRAAQIGFISLKNSYETTGVRKFKSLFRRGRAITDEGTRLASLFPMESPASQVGQMYG